VDEDGRAALVDRAVELEQALCKSMASLGPEPWLEVDMTMAQLKTFFVLAAGAPEEAAGLRVSDLARRLGVSLPTASALVDRLVERGLVDRREDPHDRRQHRLRLAPDGDRLLTRFFEGSRARSRRLFAELPEHELEVVLQGIRYLIRAAERLTSAPLAAMASTAIGA
jgi:DNA-binding MarR family transcriptional regulator